MEEFLNIYSRVKFKKSTLEVEDFLTINRSNFRKKFEDLSKMNYFYSLYKNLKLVNREDSDFADSALMLLLNETIKINKLNKFNHYEDSNIIDCFTVIEPTETNFYMFISELLKKVNDLNSQVYTKILIRDLPVYVGKYLSSKNYKNNMKLYNTAKQDVDKAIQSLLEIVLNLLPENTIIELYDRPYLVQCEKILLNFEGQEFNNSVQYLLLGQDILIEALKNVNKPICTKVSFCATNEYLEKLRKVIMNLTGMQSFQINNAYFRGLTLKPTQTIDDVHKVLIAKLQAKFSHIENLEETLEKAILNSKNSSVKIDIVDKELFEKIKTLDKVEHVFYNIGKTKTQINSLNENNIISEIDINCAGVEDKRDLLNLILLSNDINIIESAESTEENITTKLNLHNLKGDYKKAIFEVNEWINSTFLINCIIEVY